MTVRVLFLVLVVGWLGAPAIANGAPPTNVAGAFAWGDFNDDGVFERVVSSPEDNCNKGAVYILTATGTTTAKWTRDTTGVLGTAACDDYFGAALAVGDFNKDGRDDLAIGAPGADDSGVSASGAVHILYGSSSGLTEAGDQLWHQDSTGILDTSEVDDFFGEVLAAGDFNCDSAAELVVGIPSENIGTTTDAGAAQVLYGSTGGLTSTDSLFYQGNGGVDGAVEGNDRFGAALATGNFNNDAISGRACYDLAVGSPTEDSGTISDAGWVYTIEGGSAGLATTGDLAFDQNTSGVADSSEGGDQFGLRLFAGDDNGDGYHDLAVTVPGDSCITGHGVGRHVFRGSSTGITVSGNHLDCDDFRCNVIAADNVYGCPSDASTVWASANADMIEMFVGHDVVLAGGGDDTILGSHGNDAIFGGAGNDIIDAGAGKDAVIAGTGNDTIVLDLDCEAVAGKVIDGGPGTDTVRSHLSSSALTSLGVTRTSIENYVSIAEGGGTCETFPYDEGPFARPKVALTWLHLPDADSVWTTTGDTVSLVVENITAEVLVVQFRALVQVRGYVVPVSVSTITIAGLDSENVAIDLGNVVPPGSYDPELLDLPTSATLSVYARTTLSGDYAGTSSAPPVYGHIENGNTAVFYREKALDEIYYGGDLIAWRAQSTPPATLVRVQTAALVPDTVP